MRIAQLIVNWNKKKCLPVYETKKRVRKSYDVHGINKKYGINKDKNLTLGKS